MYDPQNPPNTGSCLHCCERSRDCQCDPRDPSEMCDVAKCLEPMVGVYDGHPLCAAHQIEDAALAADDEIDEPYVTVYASC